MTAQLSQMAADAMTELTQAHQQTADALVSLEIHRLALLECETRFTLNGLEGSNEAARKASLTEKTWKEIGFVFDAEQDLIRARARLEIAKVRFRTVEMTVEIAKLAEVHHG